MTEYVTKEAVLEVLHILQELQNELEYSSWARIYDVRQVKERKHKQIPEEVMDIETALEELKKYIDAKLDYIQELLESEE